MAVETAMALEALSDGLDVVVAHNDPANTDSNTLIQQLKT